MSMTKSEVVALLAVLIDRENPEAMLSMACEILGSAEIAWHEYINGPLPVIPPESK